DATGNEITSTSHVANMNSFRYRGYYYDAETGFYYVSSRYYDPEIGRFLNADTTEILSISPMLMTDKNLFAYCDNNPIVRVDVMGNVWETVFDVISLGASIAEVVANPQDPWAWAGVVGDTVDLIPFVSGVGEVTRAVKIANRAVDNIDTAKDIAKIATTGTPNKIGKVGESLAGINTKAKQRININGRVRIPDAMTNTTLTEVKNVKYISNTQQLKDFADYARLSNLNLILYVRPTTKISNTVLDAGWAIRKLW
ncbi:MAG: hypothetical protein II981_02590, partial [Bacteroidales bacterium]|nr:hypothetical protein [Bacteroidales bacterium]